MPGDVQQGDEFSHLPLKGQHRAPGLLCLQKPVRGQDTFLAPEGVRPAQGRPVPTLGYQVTLL